MSITYNLVLGEIKKLTDKKIKALLGRERLKFSHEAIAKYLFSIIKHQQNLYTYKQIYIDEKIRGTYENFVKNINLMAKLMQFLFYQFNIEKNITATADYNIIDTTIIIEKETKSISKKDWDTQRVTTRDKIHYCGSKGLVFLNQHGLITRADRIKINASDHNILKDIRLYSHYLRGNILADRGFSSKLVRERFIEANSNFYQPLPYPCNLVSPYVKKSVIQLSEEDKLIYKQRWQIEILFQKIKNIYGNFRLFFKGKHTERHKQAKFYASMIIYNLSIAR